MFIKKIKKKFGVVEPDTMKQFIDTLELIK